MLESITTKDSSQPMNHRPVLSSEVTLSHCELAIVSAEFGLAREATRVETRRHIVKTRSSARHCSSCEAHSSSETLRRLIVKYVITSIMAAQVSHRIRELRGSAS
jgi:hypothetical protein